MISILMTAIAFAGSADGAITRELHLEPGKAPIAASYRPEVATSMKTVGMAQGSRPSTQRCQWTARVTVVREVSQPESAGVSTRLADERVFRGSVPGSCEAARSRVERDMTALAPAIRNHVAAIAARDERPMQDDLRALVKLAAN
jgi:hypothetical protein